MCNGFEKAVNSLHASEKYDIYITGSNAFLLSSDLATLFTGRTFEIEVFPFSLKEFVSYYGGNDLHEAYNRYLIEGGMPGSYVYKNPIDKAKYIGYLCKAFAFYKVKRYDIQGKKYLSTTEKYYLSDHSFMYAKLGTKNPDYERVLDNIVALELLRRGYEIYVGVLYNKEIDFVTIKGNEKKYIQVSNSIEDERTKERELDSLMRI